MVAGDNSNGETTIATITDKEGNAIGKVTDVKSAAVHWLFGQEANTVALFLILGAGAWFGQWLITTGIPLHLQSIHAGYQEIAKENRDCMKELAGQHEKAVDKLQTSFEKAIDKHEKAFSEGFRAAKGNGL